MAGWLSIVFLFQTILTFDGKTVTHFSLEGRTVQDLLDHFHVALSSKDIVQPGLGEKIRWGTRVEVIRVSEKVEEKIEEIDFILNWKRRSSKNLRKVEIQNGYRKKVFWTVQRILYNGKEVSVKKSIKKVKKTPVQKLVLFNQKGVPEKIYDCSRVSKIRMIATAYWEGDPQVPGTITYSGHRVKRGLVAIDPKVIPLGSRLYIPGYGYGYASDTGSAIKGNRIDLFVENKEASRQWEYKRVDVYILEKTKKW